MKRKLILSPGGDPREQSQTWFTATPQIWMVKPCKTHGFPNVFPYFVSLKQQLSELASKVYLGDLDETL